VSSLIVVDQPLCCSSGLCGASPDPVLMRFSEDVTWLTTNGVAVERINPSEDPERFLAQPAVAAEFEAHGNACLPIVLRDGEIVSTGHYPGRDELTHLAGLNGHLQGLMTPAIEELIALGAAVAANCEPCFRYHYARARDLGATRRDMAQAVAVAQTVKDTPARAMLEMATRYLSPTPATAAVSATAEPAAEAGCCGETADPAAVVHSADPQAPSSSCC